MPIKKIAIIISTLFVCYQSMSYAFDLKGELKGVIKEGIDKQLGKPDTSGPSNETTTDKAANNNANTANESNTQPAINLKKPSKQDEIALGREITGNILGASPLVDDAALQEYVNKVGRWVASQSERADLPWHFGVIDSEDINAFAAPGGYVLITKGLYRKLNSESQLAGVLGHEIGHVVKKHQLKIIQKQQLLNYGASLLGGALGKDNATAQKLIGSGAEISARSLDKSAEFEADRMGMVLAARAGYDAYGLVEVLEEISNVSKQDSSVALLFKTHPSPEERLNNLGESVGTAFDKSATGKTLEDRLYKIKG